MKRKKMYAVLLPVLAIAAMAIAASAAQAAIPHWYSNGVRLAFPETKEVSTFGKLSLSNASTGSVTCNVLDEGTITNTSLTTAGTDSISVFINSKCKSSPTACPGITITAEKLPWATELTEPSPGVFRDKIKGIQVKLVCPGVVEGTFTGELSPKFVNGTTVSAIEFDGESGSLTSGIGSGTVTGRDNVAGTEKGEVITVKGP
jgi:hypothetical protein